MQIFFFSKVVPFLFKWLPWIIGAAILYFLYTRITGFEKRGEEIAQLKKEKTEERKNTEAAKAEAAKKQRERDSTATLLQMNRGIQRKADSLYTLAERRRAAQMANIIKWVSTATAKEKQDTLAAIASRGEDKPAPALESKLDSSGKEEAALFTPKQRDKILWDILAGQELSKQADTTDRARAIYTSLLTSVKDSIFSKIDNRLPNRHFLGINWRDELRELKPEIENILLIHAKKK